MCGTSSSPTARAPRAVNAFMAPAPWLLLKYLQCSADQHSFAGRTAGFAGISQCLPIHAAIWGQQAAALTMRRIH